MKLHKCEATIIILRSCLDILNDFDGLGNGEKCRAYIAPCGASFLAKCDYVKSKDGNTLIKYREGILSRWAEHLSELLNHINPTDPTFVDLLDKGRVSWVDQLPQLPAIPLPDLDTTPSFHEVRRQ